MAGRVTPTQFRLEAHVLSQIDALRDRLGLRSRAEVVRQAVRRLALVEGLVSLPGPAPPPEKIPEKTSG